MGSFRFVWLDNLIIRKERQLKMQTTLTIWILNTNGKTIANWLPVYLQLDREGNNEQAALNTKERFLFL